MAYPVRNHEVEVNRYRSGELRLMQTHAGVRIQEEWRIVSTYFDDQGQSVIHNGMEWKDLPLVNEDGEPIGKFLVDGRVLATI